MAWKFSVLVVANVTAGSDELLQALKERAARGACSFHLLVPATGHRMGGREAAQERLEEALGRMRGEGLEVDGTVGDADPVAAVHEIWDPSRFDEIVISTLPTGASRWLQVDLPHRVEKMTDVQVLHVIAQEKKAPRVQHVEREPQDHGVLSPLAAITGRGRARKA